MNLFISYLFNDPEFFFGTALVVVLSICTHELCHAYAALRQGDPTAADAGHLTLNPLRQMGVMSLVMFFFVGLAWGQVPVNPARMRHRYSPALVAFAGPAANFLLFLVFTGLLAAVAAAGYSDTFSARMLLQAAALNVVLFLLNLMPLPGFDGWAILTNLAPALRRSDSELFKGSMLVVLMLVFVGIRYFYMAGYLAAGTLGQYLYKLLPHAGV